MFVDAKFLKACSVERFQVVIDERRIIEHQPHIFMFDVDVSVPPQFIDGPDIILIGDKNDVACALFDGPCEVLGDAKTMLVSRRDDLETDTLLKLAN